jgi:hypothetical protein
LALDQDEEAVFVAAYGARAGDDDKWYVDSGATHHLSSRREWFADYKDIPERNICLADNRVVVAKGMGTVHVKLEVDGKKENGSFREVLYVPQLHANLLSISRMAARNFKVIFDNAGCIIKNRGGRTMATAIKEKNLYQLAAKAQEVKDGDAAASTDMEHARLTIGHDGPQSFVKARSRPDAKQWEQAAQTDDSIMNGTWTLVELPPGRKQLDASGSSRSAGNVGKHKARLIAKDTRCCLPRNIAAINRRKGHTLSKHSRKSNARDAGDLPMQWERQADIHRIRAKATGWPSREFSDISRQRRSHARMQIEI